MKGIIKVLTIFYILFPLVAVSYTAYKLNSGYYLFAIPFYYFGVIMVAQKQKIIFLIPILFCGWFWFTYGFSIHDFVFFLFIWMAFGALFYMLTGNVQRFVTRTVPENKEMMEYDAKMVQMNAKVEEFKLKNPTTKITPEVLDTIRNDVFFK